jgi:O-antigen/teichoic acid export membrane protein
VASLARNTAWLTLAKTLSVAIYAVFGLVLPRLVEEEVNGVYTLMSTLLFFGGMAASFGVPTILIRNVARDRGSAPAAYRRARLALVTGSLLAAGVLLGYLLAEMAVQGSYDGERVALAALVGALVLADALGGLGEAMFQAHEEMAYPARIEVATGLVRGGGALACLLGLPEAGLFGVFGCFLAGSVVRALVLSRAVRRTFLAGGPGPAPRWREALALVRESLGVALFRVMRMLRNRADSLLLGLLIVPAAGLSMMEAADGARALYGQALRVAFVFHTLTLALNTAIFPRLARLGGEEGDAGEARRQFARVVRYQAWWAAPLAAAVFLWSDALAGWFGPAYLEGIPGIPGTTGEVLRVLVLAVLLDAVGGPVGMLLVGRPEMDRRLPWIGASLAAVNVALNLVLIPRHGIVGAAYASLGASLFEIAVKLRYARLLLGTARSLLGAAPYVLLAAALAAGAALTPLRAHPLLGVAVGAPAYLGLAWLLGLLDPAVLRAARGAWSRLRGAAS